MLKRYSLILFLVLSVLFCHIHAMPQVFPNLLSAAQDPAGINWKEIKTEHFRIIFPEDVENDAQKLANTMERIYSAVHHSLPADEKKTPIILRMNYAQSNGFATLAPRRSEWYNTPPQDAFQGVMGWYDGLGIHEYRHMVQFDSLDSGMNSCAKVFFGEEMYMGCIGFSIPYWFYEGDAVLTETCLSKGGRGRTPAFDVDLRAQLLNGIRYDYYKAMLGSYDDYDPLASPYLLGYFMNAHMRSKYGTDALVKANRRTSYLSCLPFRHTHAVDHVTGKYSSDIYDDVMDELTKKWRQQLDGIRMTPVKTEVKGRYRDWIKHLSPEDIGGGRLAYIRYGMYDRISIVIKDVSSNETRAVDACPMDSIISGAAGRVAWAEEVPDVRWGLRSSSDIYLYDCNRNRTVRLTRGQRFYAPSLSPDGKIIAAVEFNNRNECSIVTIDALTGQVLFREKSPGNEFIQAPSWTPDGRSLVYCSTDYSKGKALWMYNAVDKSRKQLIPHGYENFSQPVSDGRYVFYSSDYSGMDAIYALELSTGKRYQVAQRPYGAYSPSISHDGSKLFFSDVSSNGYDVASVVIDPAVWTPLEKIEVRRVEYFQDVMPQEKGYSLGDIPDEKHPVEDYSGITTAFSFHSWYRIPNPLSRDVSVAVKSTNLLGTFGTMAGYVYNWNENTHAGMALLSYAGLYPVFDLSGVVGTRASTYTEDDDGDGKTKSHFYSWMEKSCGLTVRLPMNFSRGTTRTGLETGIRGDVVYISDQEPDGFKYTNNNGLFTPVTYYMSFYRLTGWSTDINPRWGQTLNLYYSHTPVKTDYTGEMFSATGMLYFPGGFRVNSLYLEGAFEYQGSDEYHYSSMMLFPRGYQYEYNDVFVKGSLNYTFMLFCPEFNLYLVYLKRVYVNGFCDIGAALEGGSQSYYRSAGVELMNDIKPFCIAMPARIDLGLRFSYLFDEDKAEGKNYNLSLALKVQLAE